TVAGRCRPPAAARGRWVGENNWVPSGRDRPEPSLHNLRQGLPYLLLTHGWLKCHIADRASYYPFVCTMGPIPHLLHLLQTNSGPPRYRENPPRSDLAFSRWKWNFRK